MAERTRTHSSPSRKTRTPMSINATVELVEGSVGSGVPWEAIPCQTRTAVTHTAASNKAMRNRKLRRELSGDEPKRVSPCVRMNLNSVIVKAQSPIFYASKPYSSSVFTLCSRRRSPKVFLQPNTVRKPPILWILRRGRRRFSSRVGVHLRADCALNDCQEPFPAHDRSDNSGVA